MLLCLDKLKRLLRKVKVISSQQLSNSARVDEKIFVVRKMRILGGTADTDS
jgi:hypothetical protein